MHAMGDGVKLEIRYLFTKLMINSLMTIQRDDECLNMTVGGCVLSRTCKGKLCSFT